MTARVKQLKGAPALGSAGVARRCDSNALTCTGIGLPISAWWGISLWRIDNEKGLAMRAEKS